MRTESRARASALPESAPVSARELSLRPVATGAIAAAVSLLLAFCTAPEKAPPMPKLTYPTTERGPQVDDFFGTLSGSQSVRPTATFSRISVRSLVLPRSSMRPLV